MSSSFSGNDKQKTVVLEQLYRQYKKLMVHVAYEILRDPYLAEDAVQSAFLKLAKNKFTIESISCNKTKYFMVIIVRNASFEIYNKGKRDFFVSEADLPMIEDALSPLDLVINEESMVEMQESLKVLDSKYADVVIMRYLYDYSLADIANLFGITEQLVRVRIHRAKRMLLEKLNREQKKMLSELNDKILDQMLPYVSQNVLDDLSDALPSDEALLLDTSLSSAFEKKMNGFFQSMKRRRFYKSVRKTALRTVAALLILLVVSTIVVFSVDALRVQVLNFFNEADKKSTTVRIEQKAIDYSPIADRIKGFYLPGYLPDTYTIQSFSQSGSSYGLLFVNAKGTTLSIYQLPENSIVGVDSENANSENLTINTKPATYYIKDNLHNLLFRYKEDIFLISGSLSKEQMILVAESMKEF